MNANLIRASYCFYINSTASPYGNEMTRKCRVRAIFQVCTESAETSYHNDV